MIEHPPNVRHGKLTYVSPRIGLGAALFGIIIAVAFMFVFANGVTGTVATPGGTAGGVVALVFMTIIFVSTVTRRRTVEFDLVNRKMTISQSLIGLPNKLILDCPFDQCRAFGRIEYDTDGHASYGVYVELLSGKRHDIPVKEKTSQEAGRVAARLSEATGIPRLDTKF
jgi:hypothetical protein